MNAIDLAKLEVSLTEAIEKWWEQIQESDIDFSAMPMVGVNIHSLMAQAAIPVLKSVHDAQEYLRAEGMMTDE